MGNSMENMHTDARVERVNLPSSPVSNDLRFQRASTALRAKFSKTGSPSSLLRIPNSNIIVPAPAVQVSLYKIDGRPSTKFTCTKKKET